MVSKEEIIQHYKDIQQKELLFDNDFSYVTFNEAFELSQNSVEQTVKIQCLEIQDLSLWIAKYWRSIVQSHLKPYMKSGNWIFAGVPVPERKVLEGLEAELNELIHLLESAV